MNYLSATIDDLYLGYLNPNSGMIIPLADTCSLNLNPFEESTRRFYLTNVKSDDTITVVASITGAKKHSYIVKVLVGMDGNDFTNATHISTSNSRLAVKKYSNGLPVDVYIKSLNKSTIPVNLSLKVIVEGPKVSTS